MNKGKFSIKAAKRFFLRPVQILNGDNYFDTASIVIFRNNVDDVAVLRKELQNVQTAMMTDIHEIKSDTKLEDMRQENETLKSELSS